MSKKILTMLAPLAALIAFAVVPAMAQATEAQCPSGTECTNGTEILGQGGVGTEELVTQLATAQNQANLTGETLNCASSEFEGSLTSNQGTHVTGSVTKDTLSSCRRGSVTTDVTTNAPIASHRRSSIRHPSPTR